MKTLNRFLNELAPIGKLEKIKATDSTIKQLVREGIKKYGDNADLNYIDVSQVTNMESLFEDMEYFNGDVSKWEVKNVTNMKWMFRGCKYFDQPLDNWNVSNVEDMTGVFAGCKKFNQPLNNWNVSNVTDMSWMFSACKNFRGDLNDWSVKITNPLKMSNMFIGCPISDDPPSWYLT